MRTTLIYLFALALFICKANASELFDIKRFDDIAVKIVSNSEVTNNPKSNRHEFLGIKDFRVIFGEDKTRFEANFYYISDKEKLEELSKVTWYSVTNKKGYKRYALYYRDNKPVNKMKEGDLLLIGKNKDTLSIYIICKNSKHTQSILSLLGVGDDDDKEIKKKRKRSKADELIDSDIDVLKHTQTGKLVIVGPVTKIQDGDTLVLGDLFKVRMQGYDAPESNQTCKNAEDKEYNCGKESTEYFQKLIGDGKISCIHQGWGVFNRHLFICKNARGEEINKQMVLEGWAVSEYTKDYKEEETIARKNKKGIWQGDFTRPKKFRKEQKELNKSKKEIR